jgi:hypothetical protein
VETVTGDAGLLTLAHDGDRMVHHAGKDSLISRVWVGGNVQDPKNTTPTRGQGRRHRSTSQVESFAVDFMRSLEWNDALLPVNPPKRSRSHVCAFMHLVLFGLYCRLRHLFDLIERKDAATFRRVLYSGCCGDSRLVSTEVEFLSGAGNCSSVFAKQMLAFWQGGICGLHGPELIFKTLQRVVADENQDLFNFIQRAFKSDLFQIDRCWLGKREFMSAYRRKEAQLLPDWLITEVKRFAKPTHQRLLLVIGHVEAASWIVPRAPDENLLELGMAEADAEILTERIRSVWKEPSNEVEAQLDFCAVSPAPPATNLIDGRPEVSDVDMALLVDSVTAIFEPTNQARSVERALVDDMEDASEIVEPTPEIQVFPSSMFSISFLSCYKCRPWGSKKLHLTLQSGVRT